MRFGDLMDHYFHCVLRDTQIHENFGYALNHRYDVFLPKTLPHVHVDDWHFTPPDVSSLRLSQCCLTSSESVRKFAQTPVSGVSFASQDGGQSNSRIGTKPDDTILLSFGV